MFSFPDKSQKYPSGQYGKMSGSAVDSSSLPNPSSFTVKLVESEIRSKLSTVDDVRSVRDVHCIPGMNGVFFAIESNSEVPVSVLRTSGIIRKSNTRFKNMLAVQLQRMFCSKWYMNQS
mmetsp:Transcript_8052/g.20043  ORF Transcript_8052/g.20043 Transcript_8052/m.20043 type:complete len:119 (+) Transcript_8052:2429-2785(+)